MSMFIDADAHVIETEQTWEFMEEEDKRFAPDLLVSERSGLRYWRIDERVVPNTNIGLNTSAESRELADVSARIAHMDELSVDVQVIYPTLFLRPLTARADVERALCRGYNRWLAEIWKQGGGRIRWVVLAPVQSMDRCIEEVRFGKANGACGVFMHGFEGQRLLSDDTFFPIFQEASDLDMPICIHAGGGNLDHYDLFAQDVFSRFKLPAVGAFNNLIYKGIPNMFPELRWCFVETTSQWVPYALNDLQIRTTAELTFRRKHADSKLAGVRGTPRELGDGNLLRDNRIYVACQTTDDLPYVIQHAGEDNIIVGTDYGHADYSNDMEAIAKLAKEGVLAEGVGDKILSDNPRRLYSL